MDTFLKAVSAVVVVTVTYAGLAVLMAYPTKWLVNYLFTPSTLMSLFGIAQLTLWKALWLDFLCATLFKGSSSSSSKSK